MRRERFLTVAAILVTALVLPRWRGEAAQADEDVALGASLAPRLDSEVLLSRRGELELRRAGGARRPVLEGLVGDAIRRQVAGWALVAARSCWANSLDCREILALRGGRGAGPGEVKEAPADRGVELVRQEAFVQGMSRTERANLYEVVIRSGAAKRGEWYFDAGDVGRRLVLGGDTSFLRQLEDRQRRDPDPALDGILSVMRALAGGQAERDLVNLIRDSVLEEVEEPPTPSETKHRSVREHTVTAILAMEVIRRHGLTSTLPELRRVTLSYRGVGTKRLQAANQESLEESSSHARSAVAAAVYRDAGRRLVELVGDLGDRRFEREQLGFTLWDQVNSAESALLKRNVLQPPQLVATE